MNTLQVTLNTISHKAKLATIDYVQEHKCFIQNCLESLEYKYPTYSGEFKIPSKLSTGLIIALCKKEGIPVYHLDCKWVSIGIDALLFEAYERDR